MPASRLAGERTRSVIPINIVVYRRVDTSLRSEVRAVARQQVCIIPAIPMVQFAASPGERLAQLAVW